ncbi:Lrp/AsnC family transcriptional regulator [Chromobacterium haemolyticum]|uniref:Lrp/AsnC family transcriptional regulator n=1 Tax=Chromobacterium haemolyticum TaxID=394935 RepID=UPI00405692D8
MNEKKPSLDRIDLKILAALQEDGRMSFQRLSEQVNLTPRPCLERVRRLEKAGLIRGYRAVVQLPAPVYPVIVAAQVALADHALSQQAFIKELQRSEAVLDAWLVAGSFDFQVRIGCRDIQQYRELAEQWLASSAFKIDKIITITELQEIKRSAGPLG